VLLERCRMAVVELHPVWARRELVSELAARRDGLEDAVHVSRVDAVKVDRVRVGAAVHELHAQEVVLGRADDRPRDSAVVRPGVELDILRDLDRAVERRQVVLTEAAGLVRKGSGRGEERVEGVWAAGSGNLVADHCRVADKWVLVAFVDRERLAASSGARPGELGERGRGYDWKRAGEQLLSAEFSQDEILF